VQSSGPNFGLVKFLVYFSTRGSYQLSGFTGNTGKMGIYKMADTEVFDYQAGAEEGIRPTRIFASR
jgi:hypothetical protein